MIGCAVPCGRGNDIVAAASHPYAFIAELVAVSLLVSDYTGAGPRTQLDAAARLHHSRLNSVVEFTVTAPRANDSCMLSGGT